MRTLLTISVLLIFCMMEIMAQSTAKEIIISKGQKEIHVKYGVDFRGFVSTLDLLTQDVDTIQYLFGRDTMVQYLSTDSTILLMVVGTHASYFLKFSKISNDWKRTNLIGAEGVGRNEPGFVNSSTQIVGASNLKLIDLKTYSLVLTIWKANSVKRYEVINLIDFDSNSVIEISHTKIE